MPALSPTMTEGTLISWQKKEGDVVAPGDVLAEIETDKATMEVEAVDEGRIGKILIAAGTEGVSVNTPIAVMLAEGEDLTTLDTYIPETMPGLGRPDEAHSAASNTQPSGLSSETEKTPPLENAPVRVFATPVARRLAAEKKISLASVSGSGPHGRIVKADILEALFVSDTPLVSGSTTPPALSPSVVSDENTQTTRMPLSGMRKTIAARLTESKQTVPHFYLSIDVRCDVLLEARADINKRLEKQGVKISVNDCIVKACAVALLRVPEANVTWENDHLMQHHRADVAVAVAVDGGLITPLVFDAGRCSLADISATIKDLAERARAGKLLPCDYQGGTFTLSNLGMLGIDTFSAILNPPQASILAVGMAVRKPVVADDGSLAVATVMNCTLSVDHRALDGAVAARFLNAIKDNLENPTMMLM